MVLRYCIRVCLCACVFIVCVCGGGGVARVCGPADYVEKTVPSYTYMYYHTQCLLDYVRACAELLSLVPSALRCVRHVPEYDFVLCNIW